MSTPTTTAPVANLRQTSMEMAAAKKPAPAKAAAEKTVTAAIPSVKAAAVKAPANITWKNLGEKNEKGECEGVGTADGREYRIMRDGDCWKATVKVGSKTTTLGENLKSGGAAWSKCVEHNKKAAK